MPTCLTPTSPTSLERLCWCIFPVVCATVDEPGSVSIEIVSTSVLHHYHRTICNVL